MNRSTLSILLLAFMMPAGAMAAANSDEATRVCPNKGKPAAVQVQDAEAAPAAPQGNAAAKGSTPRSSGTPAIRSPSQRWHSVLPGMVR